MYSNPTPYANFLSLGDRAGAFRTGPEGLL